LLSLDLIKYLPLESCQKFITCGGEIETTLKGVYWESREADLVAEISKKKIKNFSFADFPPARGVFRSLMI
jgi:hypothetical protein